MPPKGGRARASRGRGDASRSSETSASTSAAPVENTTPATLQQQHAIPASDDPRSDTVTPAPAAPTPKTPLTRPSTTPTPAASSPRAKFKPKAVRRGEEERLRRAEEIAKLQEQRNAEEAKFSSRIARGRGRGRGRARGAFRALGRGSAAAGPLSAGMACELPSASFLAVKA